MTVEDMAREIADKTIALMLENARHTANLIENFPYTGAQGLRMWANTFESEWKKDQLNAVK